MRALVTGSNGFLGRYFVRALRQEGAKVYCVDTAHGEDCRDFLRRDIGHWDIAVHCAAVVEGRETIERHPTRQIVDLALDAEYFDWALRVRPARTVYISSSAVYPVAFQLGPDNPRLAEDDIDLNRDPLLPDRLYGWTKLTGEKLAALAREEGLGVTVVRPFSGYGGDQAPTYPFRAILERVLHRNDPLEVWGDGQQVRDWIHVDDLVGGTLELARQRVDGPVNLCSGDGVSIAELAGLMATCAGYKPEIRPLADKPAGVRHRVGDPTRFFENYWPKVNLEEGVRRALREALA